MGLQVKSYQLGNQAENQVDPELGLGFVREQLVVPGPTGKPQPGNVMLLLHPHGRNDEPRYRRFVVGQMTLIREMDSGIDQITGDGQVIVTGRRFLGMFTKGTYGTKAFNEDAGRVACFTFERADVVHVTVGTNWRGKPKQITIGLSTTGSAPADIALIINVVALTINISNRQARLSSVQALAEAMDDEAVAELL